MYFMSRETMSNVKLVWATPNAEQLIADMARVSAPENQGKEASKLLAYCIRNEHWSIFEMVNVCMEINTTRDIARQILRHRSFSFQEFSQRYAEVGKLPEQPYRQARMQDSKNRQNSLETPDRGVHEKWSLMQGRVDDITKHYYEEALKLGIAKEVARAILPEGLTSSRMYQNGTLRSWMHYCKLRCDAATQKEHRDIAIQASEILEGLFPNVWLALMEDTGA
jgi:thymidylate synthase (FAD)